MHHRLAPPEHRFVYPIYMLLLDLEELPDLGRNMRLFRHNRWGVVSFCENDYLPGSATDLRTRLDLLLRSHGLGIPGGRVLVLTHPRLLGYAFNPVSFFYCYDSAGHLSATVAEVRNTFGDRHVYLADASRWTDKKVMHVSPFFSMSGSYDWHLPEPTATKVLARVDLVEAGRPLLKAELSLSLQPLTDGLLARTICRYPCMTAKVILAIHWEALRLRAKGARFHKRPPYDPASVHREAP